MKSETKRCQNCKEDFIIESEDFLFYEKINIPPPTFCPFCRRQRKMAFRNTHCLYKRKDSFSGKDIISIYSPDKDLVVIDQKTWWGDSWDPLAYGRSYDFSKPFFEQWKNLRDNFPLQSMSNSKAVNSDYCNVAEESYDSYLVSATWHSERVMYSDSVTNNKDCLDLHIAHKNEFCYEDVSCTDSHKLFYSQNSHLCVDSYFLYNCRGCVSCFMCSNLRNKSYCFNNQQFSKEEYFEKINSINLDSYITILEKKKEFAVLKLKAIHKFAHILNSHDVTGDNLENAKNCHECFYLSGGAEDSKYLYWGGFQAKDVYDSVAIAQGELIYEALDGAVNGNRNLFTSVVYNSRNVEYSFNCYNSSNLFGCIGLRNKKYCILNKQYSKEEYEDLILKIKKHMMNLPYIDKTGCRYCYGEFFPVELSPFCYNETVAQDFFSLTKEKAKEKGFLWKNSENRNYIPTIKSKNIPDSIQNISDDITNEIIECIHEGKCEDRCTFAFKILPNELLFYKRFKIPLPRLCYGCRHYARLKQRNPVQLWHRQCMKPNCFNEFETSYSPDRPEVVYCENCYNKEVY